MKLLFSVRRFASGGPGLDGGSADYCIDPKFLFLFLYISNYGWLAQISRVRLCILSLLL